MKSARTRIGVFLLVLAYLGQSLSVAAHAAAMLQWQMAAVTAEDSTAVQLKPNMISCHDQVSESSNQDLEIPLKKNCCEDNCSQFNCHSVSVIINNLVYTRFVSSSTLIVTDVPTALAASIQTLYRPPITG